jgi:hypothetical protein
VDLKFSTGISPQSLGKIIPETCSAIFHALRGQYLKVTHFFCSKSGKLGGPWRSMPPAMYTTFQRATLIHPSWLWRNNIEIVMTSLPVTLTPLTPSL